MLSIAARFRIVREGGAIAGSQFGVAIAKEE